MDTLYVSAYLIASPSVSPFLPVSRSCSLSSLMSNLTAASSLVSPLIFLRYFRRFPIVPTGRNITIVINPSLRVPCANVAIFRTYICLYCSFAHLHSCSYIFLVVLYDSEFP